MGSSEYLMKVQNLSKADTAGISQPQTLAQKLRYELKAEQEEDMDALQDKLGKLYSSIEGAEESSRFLTYNVVRSKTYERDVPKLITMEGAQNLFLENPEQRKLLPAPRPAETSANEEAGEAPRAYAEDLNSID